LARAGSDPVVIDANADHVRRLREPGLEIAGLDGGVRTKLAAYTPQDAAGELEREPHVVLLAVRSHATRDALTMLGPHLGPRTDIVSLQNGLNEDAIAEIVGAVRTIGCVVGFGATWIEPGRISLDANGDLTLGRLDSSVDARLEAVRELLQAAFKTTISDNIRGALWGKMLVNSMTVLGALGGMLTGDVLVTPQRRRVVAEIVAEGVDVAFAEGVELPNVFGIVPARYIHMRGSDWLQTMDRVLIRVGEAFGAIRSVTWRDIELGRPTEIDAVTGEIVRRGKSNGTPTPLSASVYAMLRELEAGARKPDATNLEALENVALSRP
jgi:2-dehydropantoate 2-reductase